jgi:hypothetical protein
MSGTFQVPIPFTSVSAAVDLAEIIGHATKPYIILEINLYQVTELGDAAEEQLKLALKSGQTTSGSGGNAAVAAPSTDAGAGTSGFTYETMNTTKASAGTITTHKNFGWNVRGPFEKVFTEYSQNVIPAATRSTLELVDAPADAITIGGYMIVQEIG